MEGQERRTRNTLEEIGWSRGIDQWEETIPFWEGCDSSQRNWVSNVTFIVGGLDDKDVMGNIIRELAIFCRIVTWAGGLQTWMDRDWERCSWGHPVFIQFQVMRDGLISLANGRM